MCNGAGELQQVEAFLNLFHPRPKKVVRGEFLGMADYNCRLVPNYLDDTSSLTDKGDTKSSSVDGDVPEVKAAGHSYILLTTLSLSCWTVGYGPCCTKGVSYQCCISATSSGGRASTLQSRKSAWPSSLG